VRKGTLTYGSYQGGDDEGDDDALEHVEKQLADVADIHRLPANSCVK
jgi:hypothetical protein